VKEIDLKIAVVGLGRAFTLMLPTFLADERVKLVGAYDPRRKATDQFRKDFEAVIYDDVESLCSDDTVEVVYIASPHQFHAEHVKIAARAGKSILVEKPLAISLDECSEIVDTVSENNVVLIVGHSHSFDGPVLQAAKLLHSGELGTSCMLNALNYTDFLYRLRRPEELDTGKGGGVVYSQAAHQVDIARLLMGGEVSTVRACIGNWDSERSADGAYSALLTFKNGGFASLTYSGYAHYDSDELLENVSEMGFMKDQWVFGVSRKRLQAVSTEGEASMKAENTYGGDHYRSALKGHAPYHQHFGQFIVSAQRADLRLTPKGVWVYGDNKRFIETPGNTIPRVEVIDELWGAVRGGVTPLHDAMWSRATMEVCIAIIESARTGKEIPMRFQVAPNLGTTSH